MIILDDFFNPERFRHLAVLPFQTGDQRYCVIVSGIAYILFKGTGGQWNKESVRLRLSISRKLPPRKGFRGNDAAVAISIAEIRNENHSVGVGYSVSNFRWNHSESDGGTIVLDATVSARDVDGYLEAITYHATIIGELYDLPPTPPPD